MKLKPRDLSMKRYFTLLVLAAASLPVFAAVDFAGNVPETDFASITLILLGVVALVATRRLNHH